MRRRVLGAAFAAALAFPGIAAAREVTIQAVDGTNTWDKPNVIVTVGDQVNWSFAGTTSFHNVKSTTHRTGRSPALANVGGPPRLEDVRRRRDLPVRLRAAQVDA